MRRGTFLHGLPPRLRMGEGRGSANQYGPAVAGRGNRMAEVVGVLRPPRAPLLASQQTNPVDGSGLGEARGISSLVVESLVLAPVACRARHEDGSRRRLQAVHYGAPSVSRVLGKRPSPDNAHLRWIRGEARHERRH